MENKEHQKLEFMLYNNLGQALSIEVFKEGKTYKLSTPQLPKGLYWLRVSDGKQEETFKMVKE